MKRSWIKRKSSLKPSKRLSIKRKPKKGKKPKEKTLKAKLDIIYSIYVRKSASDASGYIDCYCSARVQWRESDNSHYIPRGCLSLRYDPRNTHPSCRKCNRFMGGNLQAYAVFLRRKYGDSILEDLDREKRIVCKNFPYQEKIDHYTKLIHTLV